MSDKTKHYRDLELIGRRIAEASANRKAELPVVCLCGHTVFERELFTIHPEGGNPSIRCANCLPPGYRWALW